MTRPSKDREGQGALAGALLVAVLSGVLFGWGSGGFTVGCLVAMAIIFVMASRHDRRHRSRGEPPHAMWGTNDRNKPWGRQSG
jgi:hypothetical protein